MMVERVRKRFLILPEFFAVFAVVIVGVMVGPMRAGAEPLKIDLANDQVNISTGFTGSKFVVFGSKTQKGDVVVVLEGPRRDFVVRRKEKVLGAWINRHSLEFEGIPSYYNFALSSEDAASGLSEQAVKEKVLGFEALKVAPKKMRYGEDKVQDFQSALIRNKQDLSLYPLKAGEVEFMDETLFRVDFDISSNVPSGDYIVRALLVDDGKISYEQTQSMKIGLVGFSSRIYKFSDEHSLLYGILCVVIACWTGWFSDFILRRG